MAQWPHLSDRAPAEVNSTASSGPDRGRPGATVLLTGATGFVGAELLSHLRDLPLRCLVRDASKLLRDDDEAGPEAVEADLADIESLRPALQGIDEVFYLVHSMEPGSEGFADRDRRAATNYAEVANSCGVRRTIYLGGIAAEDDDSEHLESRHEVEEVLGEATPEFVALRASMIVGARSASFRTLVQLVDRLPVLAMPSWRESRTQPIGIDDVVACLLAAREVDPGVYSIAGPDILTFEEMTEVVSEILGQPHRSVPVPVSSTRAEAALAALVTDQDRELLGPLMGGLHSDLLVDDNAVSRVFGVEPASFRDAAAASLAGMRADGALPS
jgi:uncharacterized protein YbjT (DUF2867 family)